MKKRGRILRDTTSGAGLISSEGKQYEFKLEGVWKSDISPATNMVVEFEVDEAEKVVSINAVAESDLAKEQAEKAMLAVKEKGGAVLDDMVARVGMPVLIATGLVAISWYFLSAVTVQVTQGMEFKIPFWNILGVANHSAGGLASLQGGGGGSVGIYGFLALIALAGPFLAQIWNNPKAHLGNCLPLLLMVFVSGSIYLDIQDGLKQAQNMRSFFGGGNQYAQQLSGAIMNQVMQAFHVGLGTYVSVIASGYLTLVGLKKYLVAKA